MKTFRVLTLILAALAGIVLAMSTAWAQSTSSTGRLLTDFVRPLVVDGYDADLGMLVAADLSLHAELDSRVVELINTSATEADFLVTTKVEFCADRSAPGITDHASCSAGPGTGRVAFEAPVLEESFTAVASGETVASATPASAVRSANERILDPDALRAFVANGPVEYLVSTLASFEAFGGGGNSIVEIETHADVTLQVEYLYAGVAIEKLTNGVDGASVAAGAQVVWTYDVTNTGNTALQDLLVTDDREGEVCAIDLLDAGTSKRCTLEGTAGTEDYRNVATVVGTPSANPALRVAAEDPSGYVVLAPTPVPPTPTPPPTPTVPSIPSTPTVPPGGPVDLRPAVDIELATNGIDADDPPGVELDVGDPITWTYVATNTGVVDLFDAVITDDLGGEVCRADFVAVASQITCTLEGEAVAGAYGPHGAVVAFSADGQRVTDVDPTHHFAQDEVLGRVVTPEPQPAGPGSEVPGSEGPPDEVLALTGQESSRRGSVALALLVGGLGAVAASKAIRRRTSVVPVSS